MVPARARVRAALISTCLTVALGGMLAAPVGGADEAAEPEVPAAEAATVAPSALAVPWTSTPLEGAEAIASGHGRFVAVGSSGHPAQAAAWSSLDGVEWTPADVVDAPVGSSLTQVVATEDGFVALGAESGMYGATKERVRAWYSSDGLGWEPASIVKPARSGLQAVATDLAAGPSGQLALGRFIGQDLGGQRLWRSDDGRSWELAKLPRVADPVWDAVVAHPNGFLLLGQSGNGKASNWRSRDGLTWKRLVDTPRLFDVAVSDGGGLAAIGHKHIYGSPKGLRSWEKALTRPRAWQAGGSNAFVFVEWDGAEFVVPGRDYSGCGPATDECHVNPLLVSVDGAAWSEAAGPDGLPGADAATWITDIASLDGATAVLGQHEGRTVVWLVSGAPTGA